MFEEVLVKYNFKGIFTFNKLDNLTEKCNAPTDFSGIYLIYDNTELLYIGSSGQKINGILKTRKSNLGGIKDRIVNGYHPKFGKIRRKIIFHEIMELENIKELTFFWYITYDYKINFDFPTDIEKKLTDIYTSEFEKLPRWHKK
ncbi:MAG: hypothetical protein JXL97_17315 [Bacteroidales bacterium]|nr:hypothetical protein [Bacteroidales bacterium]